MKNLIFYYSAILIPLALLFWTANAGHSKWFAILIITYAIPYRLLIDSIRLVSKKIITWNESWKLLIPWLYIDYFSELYFKK